MIDAQLGALLASVVGGYMLGSIPIAWLIARGHLGQDIRTLGSGNVGVLNTALSVHRWAGLVVFLVEIAKGVAAVAVGALAVGTDVGVGLTAVAAFIGTRWPVWLHFHGGRGNTIAATSLALVSPLTIALLAWLWLVVRRVAGSNFVATRVMLAALAPTLGLSTLSWWWTAIGLAYAALFLTTHDEETDDHLLLRRHYPTVAAFLTSPRRRGQHAGQAQSDLRRAAGDPGPPVKATVAPARWSSRRRARAEPRG